MKRRRVAFVGIKMCVATSTLIVLAPFIQTRSSTGALLALTQEPQEKIAAIDFFGQTGLDFEAVRKAVPTREGDTFPQSDDAAEHLIVGIKQAVQMAGVSVTDVSFSCCEYKGGWTVFVGLNGPTVRQIAYRSSPTEDIVLPADGITIYRRAMEAVPEAAKHGATEDDSRGYSLSSDATLRAYQLAMRQYALRQEEAIHRVIVRSQNREQRAAAAMLLGYARLSNQQIELLTEASRDSSDLVRNNAIRSLALITKANRRLVGRIPTGFLMDLLYSGSWDDRDKGAYLLDALCTSRNSELLQKIRADATASLIEMAEWHAEAKSARLVLGRIGGIDEARLQELIRNGQTSEIMGRLPR
jgi:hypothetical protein